MGRVSNDMQKMIVRMTGIEVLISKFMHTKNDLE